MSDATANIVAPAVPHHRRKILAMACVAGAVVTNIYYNQPILPLIARDLGVPEGTVGLIPGFTLAGFALGLLTLVPLGDRFDRRRLVLIQTGCACVFALLAAVAPGLPLLLVASLGLGMASTVPQQLVPFAAAMSPPQERGRSVGTVVSGIMIGILLGRTIGGGVSALLGWRAVFMMAAGFMVIVGVVISFLLPVGRPTTDLSYRRLLASLWPLARDHRLLRDAMVTQALLWAAFNAFWANLASLLADSPLHLGSFWAGGFGLVGAAGALAASVGGRAADRIGPWRVVAYSIALVTIAYVILFGASVSMAALLVGVVVLDFGLQAALVSNQMRAFSIDPEAQGRINTLYMTATFLGGAVGAAISGWLMSLFGWSGVASLGCAAGLAAGLYHGGSHDHRIPGPTR